MATTRGLIPGNWCESNCMRLRVTQKDAKMMHRWCLNDAELIPEDAQNDAKRVQKDAKMVHLRTKIAESQFSEYEVLILASILEREANDAVSMQMVSSILQNRLAIGSYNAKS